jgi:hypothetical protein
MLETGRAGIVIRRRSSGWETEIIQGPDSELRLPGVGVTIPMGNIYHRQPPQPRHRVIACQVTCVADSARNKLADVTGRTS